MTFGNFCKMGSISTTPEGGYDEMKVRVKCLLVTFLHCLPCIRHFQMLFMCFFLQHKEVGTVIPFYIAGNQSTGKLGNLPKLTQQ